MLSRKLAHLWTAGVVKSHEAWVQNAEKDRLIYQVIAGEEFPQDSNLVSINFNYYGQLLRANTLYLVS